jgi:hypothetical protein
MLGRVGVAGELNKYTYQPAVKYKESESRVQKDRASRHPL